MIVPVACGVTARLTNGWTSICMVNSYRCCYSPLNLAPCAFVFLGCARYKLHRYSSGVCRNAAKLDPRILYLKPDYHVQRCAKRRNSVREATRSCRAETQPGGTATQTAVEATPSDLYSSVRSSEKKARFH